MQDTATSVLLWWGALCVLAVGNVCFWAYAVVAFLRRARTAPQAEVARSPHVWLSGGYVLGTAFLWLLPRASLERQVLVDSWLSSPLLGRSVQTVAELCFLMQWALLLREYARAERSSFGEQVASAIVPLGLGAQVCAWFGVVTQNHAGLAAQAALFAIIASAVGLALADLWKRAFSPMRTFLALCIVCCVVFTLYTWTVSVPLHLARDHAARAAHAAHLPWATGLMDAARHWVVARDYATWQAELGFTPLYASVTLWLSLAFMRAPVSARSLRVTPLAPESGLAPRIEELPHPQRLTQP